MKINYLQFPVIRDLGVSTLRKQRAANKKAAFGLSKNLKIKANKRKNSNTSCGNQGKRI